MIYKHHHIKPDLFTLQHESVISQSSPIAVIIEKEQFLHYTIDMSLKYLNIPYFISEIKSSNLEGNRKNMGHQLPTLAYSNHILETNQLVQFLSDAFCQDHQLLDFQARKAWAKQTVKVWKQIFLFERFYPSQFSKLKHLGVHNKKDYFNLVFQQLQILSTQFHSKLIQRAFSGYSEETPCLQTFLFTDIISTILKQIPLSFVDHCLRGYFEKLIPLHLRFQNQIRNLVAREKIEHKVIFIKKQVKERVEVLKLWNLNRNKFLVTLGVVGIIYGIFVEN